MGHGVSLGIGRGINHAAVHGVGHQVMIMAKETSSNQFPHWSAKPTCQPISSKIPAMASLTLKTILKQLDFMLSGRKTSAACSDPGGLATRRRSKKLSRRSVSSKYKIFGQCAQRVCLHLTSSPHANSSNWVPFVRKSIGQCAALHDKHYILFTPS